MEIPAVLKAKVEDIFKKISEDKDFGERFKKDPVKAVESIVGVDLPDDQINAVIAAVKAKLAADGVSGLLSKLKF